MCRASEVAPFSFVKEVSNIRRSASPGNRWAGMERDMGYQRYASRWCSTAPVAGASARESRRSFQLRRSTTNSPGRSLASTSSKFASALSGSRK